MSWSRCFSPHLFLYISSPVYKVRTLECYKEVKVNVFLAYTHFLQVTNVSLTLTVSTGAETGQRVQSHLMAPVRSTRWVDRLLHRSVLICTRGLQSHNEAGLGFGPLGLNSWLVSQFTVREGVVCSLKVTAAWYPWGFPAGWCPWLHGRQSGCFLCPPPWWSGGKAASLGSSSFGWTTAPETPGRSRARTHNEPRFGCLSLVIGFPKCHVTLCELLEILLQILRNTNGSSSCFFILFHFVLTVAVSFRT